MNSRGQGFPLRVYTELTFILYDYCQKINENLLTDGWTVERIIPIGDEYYNVLMYQEASGSSVNLLFDYSEPEYKVLYLQDGNMPFSLETHYMSQFDWEPFDREEKVMSDNGRCRNFMEILLVSAVCRFRTIERYGFV
ncbi:MAG: hypothetical protein NC079_07790 [Clostridium sp.]|nr:hypothetical protein [Acetatifactor muris]MCM1527818.1 hypothetical protein [Bacteroides sp.]MCM1563498.1 hypothetical protein [Clostridium sp.]